MRGKGKGRKERGRGVDKGIRGGGARRENRR